MVDWNMWRRRTSFCVEGYICTLVYMYVDPIIHIYLYIYKVVQIWPGQTVTSLHTISPGHIWTTLYNYVCTYVFVYICIHIHIYISIYGAIPNRPLKIISTEERNRPISVVSTTKELKMLNLHKHRAPDTVAPALVNF
jgi:hypothetical protein